MLPIYVMNDVGITAFEQDCIKEAMHEFKTMFPERTITYFGARSWKSGNFSSANWFISKAQRCMSEKGTTLFYAESIVDLMEADPQLKYPRISVLFTSRELVTRDTVSCSSFTRGRNSVQSFYRYRMLGPAKRRLAIKSMIWHELGCILGAGANPVREGVVVELSGTYCANCACAMSNIESLEKRILRAKGAKESGQIYCPRCVRDILRSEI